jgi:hypothetical protein
MSRSSEADENDSSRNCWVIANNVIISCAFLCEHWPHPVFLKKRLSHNKKKLNYSIPFDKEFYGLLNGI